MTKGALFSINESGVSAEVRAELSFESWCEHLERSVGYELMFFVLR